MFSYLLKVICDMIRRTVWYTLKTRVNIIHVQYSDRQLCHLLVIVLSLNINVMHCTASGIVK